MKSTIFQWIEEYLFIQNRLSQKLLSLLLRPFSLVYCFIMSVRRLVITPQFFPLPIISVGNLTIGGNGKTPFSIALARHFSGGCVVMRGYGRHSSGMIVVNHQNKILCDVDTSGDEAMEIALATPQTTVIVCEKREEGIAKAQELRCRYVILDDGFSKVHIEKLDILLEPSNKLPPYCLPSGPYRESPFTQAKANLHLKEGRDFFREVHIKDETSSMVLATSIAKAWRLDPFLPSNVMAKLIKPDHSYFEKSELQAFLNDHNATSLLVTMKDYVKISTFNLPLTILELQIKINPDVLDAITTYLTQFHKDSGKIEADYTKESV